MLWRRAAWGEKFTTASSCFAGVCSVTHTRHVDTNLRFPKTTEIFKCCSAFITEIQFASCARLLSALLAAQAASCCPSSSSSSSSSSSLQRRRRSCMHDSATSLQVKQNDILQHQPPSFPLSLNLHDAFLPPPASPPPPPPLPPPPPHLFRRLQAPPLLPSPNSQKHTLILLHNPKTRCPTPARRRRPPRLRRHRTVRSLHRPRAA